MAQYKLKGSLLGRIHRVKTRLLKDMGKRSQGHIIRINQNHQKILLFKFILLQALYKAASQSLPALLLPKVSQKQAIS
jgi:hypothetical protein